MSAVRSALKLLDDGDMMFVAMLLIQAEGGGPVTVGKGGSGEGDNPSESHYRSGYK